MKKVIVIGNKTHTMEIVWDTEKYYLRIIGVTGFKTLPPKLLHNIDKIKEFIIKSMDDNQEFKTIDAWDGII